MNAQLARFTTDDDWQRVDLLGGNRPIATGPIWTQPVTTEGPPPRRRTGLLVKCNVTHPPSLAGKPINLFLTDQDVTELLLALRESAITARSEAASDGE